MIHQVLLSYFTKYSNEIAPFMHQQLAEWGVTKPLSGLRVVHHVPLVPNTLLKIACLVGSGADVTVTNPFSFMSAHPEAVQCLHESGIRYVQNLEDLRGELFDLFFDCGAELYQALGKPRIGAVELTGSGDSFYRNQSLDFPVISIDRTLTKQLETVFGCAENISPAILQLSGINPIEKSWIIFGFGKIGRGLAYSCVQNNAPVVVVELCEKQRALAQELGLNAIAPTDTLQVQSSLQKAEVVVTATGKKGALSAYPHDWFCGKILANMGIYDEFGTQFLANEILNEKNPVNFVLDDPTPMRFIDPEFYAHNIAALSLLGDNLTAKVYDLSEQIDKEIISTWCKHHSVNLDIINKWFMSNELFDSNNHPNTSFELA